MMSLTHLALRYLLWMVGLRVLYLIGIQLFGLPHAQGTFVILASLPAAEIGMRMVKRATRRLELSDWATAWGVMMAVYVLINLVFPALLMQPFRIAFGDPAFVSQMAIIVGSVGVLVAMFLYIGKNAARARH